MKLNPRTTLVYEPYALPLDVREAKSRAGISITEDDKDVKVLIRAATADAQRIAARQFVVATFKLNLDRFPYGMDDTNEWEPFFAGYGRASSIKLPNPPALSIDSVKNKDQATGVLTTISSSLYFLDSVSEPGVLLLNYGQVWPYARLEANSVEIQYKAGYLTPFTIAKATATITGYGRTFTSGDLVRLSNSGGALPMGLSEDTDYFVRDVSGSTFALAATSGGTAITVTDAGVGTHYIGTLPASIRDALLLMVSARYEYTEGGDSYNKAMEAAATLLSSEWTGEIYAQC